MQREAPAPSKNGLTILGFLLSLIPVSIHAWWIYIVHDHEQLSQAELRAMYLNGLPGSPSDTTLYSIIVVLTSVASIVLATLGRRNANKLWTAIAFAVTGLAGLALALQLFSMM